MLSASELAQMRADILPSLPDTATIIRITKAPDGMGGYTETTSTTTSPCRLGRPALTGQSEGMIGGMITAAQRFPLTFPASTEVTVQDRVTIGSRHFEIVGFAVDSWEIGRRMLGVELI